MFSGYVLMAVPGMSLTVTIVSLFTIAFGNGLFKGNLQAVVGQMYDDPKYSDRRDTAFLIFYMGINVGAFFAPFAATGIRNWWLNVNGFTHDGSLPALCHQFINGTLSDTSTLQQLANTVSLSGPVTDLGAFAAKYLEVFSRGYNYAFGIAASAMIISLLVYTFFNKLLPRKEVTVSDALEKVEFKPMVLFFAALAMLVTAYALHFIKNVGWTSGFAFGLFAAFVTWIVLSSRKEEMQRIVALVLVFIVVVFFWMSFHQNGLTLTFFARDYTVKHVGPLTNLFFTLPSILAVIGSIAGLVILVRSGLKRNSRIAGGILLVISFLYSSFLITGFDPVGILGGWLTPFGESNSIYPEIFQSFNPLFIVALTFPVMGAFAWMARKGIEPSTPKKIGIGMIIAAVGFTVVLISSIKLPSPSSLAGAPVNDALRVSPYWLINSYLILTVAELFLSPMGLSFVSKVAPSRFQGLMQGGWLLATAVGNKLLVVGSILWDKVALSTLWMVFIICCLVSAAFMFSIMKRLERASNS
jgi:POT family proton-dependent oligopeptide transporter